MPFILLGLGLLGLFLLWGPSCERPFTMTAHMQGGALSHTVCLK
jgi:hypothetical protein